MLANLNKNTSQPGNTYNNQLLEKTGAGIRGSLSRMLNLLNRPADTSNHLPNLRAKTLHELRYENSTTLQYVKEIQLYMQIKSGHIHANPIMLEPKYLLEDLYNRVDVSRDQNTEFILDIPDQLKPILADHYLLHQALNSLLYRAFNSGKYHLLVLGSFMAENYLSIFLDAEKTNLESNHQENTETLSFDFCEFIAQIHGGRFILHSENQDSDCFLLLLPYC